MSKPLVVKQHVPRSDRPPSLLTLLTRDRISEQCPLHLIVEEINQLLSKDTNQWAKITPLVASLFANIGVLEEIQRQVRQHHRKLFYPFCPWSNSQHGKSSMVSDMVGSNTTVLFTVHQALKDVNWNKYGSPKNGRFHYPAEKQRTEQHTLQMRRAEHHLDSLWKKVDSLIEATFGGSSLGGLFPALDFSERELQRTRE